VPCRRPPDDRARRSADAFSYNRASHIGSDPAVAARDAVPHGKTQLSDLINGAQLRLDKEAIGNLNAASRY
jgi:hypothetical protein